LDSDQEKQALITSLRLLAASPKSRRGLQKKLEAKGYAREIIEKTLIRLEQQGVVNDQMFAQDLFQNLSARRFSGRKRIAFEMERRGVGTATVRELLEGYKPEEERAKAFEVARLKRERWMRLDKPKRRKRIYDFLVRRGFDFSLSKEVTDEIERNDK